MPNGAFFVERNGFTVLQHHPADLEELTARTHGHGHGENNKSNTAARATPVNKDFTLRSHAYKVNFVNANSKSVSVIPDKALATYNNYFLGNDPKRWQTNVPHYLRVKYEDLYPGVDLIYYGNQQQLEYDFIIAPGTEPSTIKFAFEGTQDFEIDAQGDLILNKPLSEIGDKVRNRLRSREE